MNTEENTINTAWTVILEVGGAYADMAPFIVAVEAGSHQEAVAKANDAASRALEQAKRGGRKCNITEDDGWVSVVFHADVTPHLEGPKDYHVINLR